MCKFIKVYKLLINCKKKNYLIDEIEVLWNVIIMSFFLEEIIG